MSAYYNEIEPFAAQWLRNLIAAGHIATGEVDERDIRDVRPDDLRGFDQCHFFAGIGGWSLALRLAGWPDERPVWTGSCPCQPFSAAGRSAGFADERHLWPAFFHLIERVRPPVVLGEQVASKDGLAWIDLVHADLEGAGYSVRAADLCAAGIGAPHIRQRLWFVAHHHHHGREGIAGAGLRRPEVHDADGCSAVGLADRECSGLEVEREQQARGQRAPAERGGAAGELGDSAQRGRSEGGACGGGYLDQGNGSADAGSVEHAEGEQVGLSGRSRQPGSADPWAAVDWLPCRDGKARPVEPGAFPLAHGVPGRVGRLRAYGNAIVPQVAAEVIGVLMECAP